MTEPLKRYWSNSARAIFSGLAVGMTLLLASSNARMAASTGIDPLEILQLQVRPNIMMVLDNSGSMGEGVGSNTQLSNEFPDSKIYIAKQVLKTFVQNNQAKVSFMFGQYQQDDNLDMTDQNRYMYATFDGAAASLTVDPSGTSKDASGAGSKMRRNNNGTFNVTSGEPLADGGQPYYLLFAARFFNRQKVYVKASNGQYCPTATGGTVGVDATLGAVDSLGAYVDIGWKTNCTDVAAAATVRFYFYGVSRSTGENGWTGIGADTTCGGFKMLSDMAACTDNAQFSTIGPFLDPELNFDASNNIVFNNGGESPAITLGTTAAIPGAPLTISPLGSRTDPTRRGLRAGANTPIAESLKDFKEIFSGTGVNGDGQNLWFTGRTNVTAISTQTPVKQRTFAIVVTDGDDTCDTPTTSASGDNPPLRAAFHAQNLFQKITTEDASGVPTFVIALGGGADPTRANWVAYGGSGMVRSTTPYGADNRWATIPTAAEVAACATCRPAFLASNATELTAALQSAIDEAVDSGEFSASASVVSTVFELTVNDTATPAAESALDPVTRYNQRINILYQTTFELPSWKGRVFAFRNDGTFQAAPGTNVRGIWEAGQTLYDNVNTYMETQTRQGRPANQFTFAELHGNETIASIGASSSALIRRRIFTSARNGKFERTESGATDPDQYDSSKTVGRNVVAVWPPNQTGLTSGISDIDPAAGIAGPLDAALGISTLTFTELQDEFGACKASTSGGPVPTACTGTAAQKLAQALKEAREMLLAYNAGAQTKKGLDGLPLRTATTEPVPNQLLYSNRGWLLLDSTLAAPAIASPPLRFTPSTHVPEFILYRDGRRAGDGQGIPEISKGFGLRNPDFDDSNPTSKTSLKPVMTVVYVAANDMLHAFRGGPQCTGGCPGSGEQGSEELWGFIPYDQLDKIRTLKFSGQQKSPHVYVIGSSVRLATIFVPDPDGYVYDGVTYTGHWRSVLYFGRGPGGKYYTALDVTAPGTFTATSYSTYPPWVLWSRGNPDTTDGTSGGTTSGTAGNRAAYAEMGQTWAVPAVGNVAASGSVTADGCTDLSGDTNVEWRVFVGSGYGEPATNEGKRIYQINAVNGDICKSILMPGRSNYNVGIPDNAFVAGPSAYNARAQDAPGISTPSTDDTVSRVYFPDVQGRIWRYTVNSGNLLYDAGANQPFGNSVALLKINNVASVFAESGNDKRVPASDGPFKMYGISDTAAVTDYGTPGTIIAGFPIDFPSPPPSNVAFRGTTQPATAFNSQGQPRIFFGGTRFNPAGTTDCLSSFDTILFAVSGNSGGAVYDFSGDGTADLYTILSGTKTTGLQVIGGSLLVGDSGSLASAPTPTPNPSPTPTPGAPTPAYVVATNLTQQSPICRSH